MNEKTNKVLQIKDLEAGYGKLQILYGIDLDVEKGDLLAIIGPNGSGKSTTLKSIFGIIKAWKGQVLLNKKNISRKSPDKIVRLGISYVPQGRRVFQKMTVQENLEMGAFILNDRNKVKERLEKVFEFFPLLEKKKKQKATFLSGGQQQMLSIGRALMLQPDILLLDEPSLGLDPGMMAEIFKIIKEINKKGTTIILVEQNAKMALEIANKVCVLQTGKIAFSGKKNKSTMQNIEKIYFGGNGK